MHQELPFKIIFKIFIKKQLAKIWPRFHVAPRYYIVIPCLVRIKDSQESFQAAIVNISSSGIFIETEKSDLLPKDTIFSLAFNFKEVDYELVLQSISGHQIMGIDNIKVDGVGAKMVCDESIEKVGQLLEVIHNMKPPVRVQE